MIKLLARRAIRSFSQRYQYDAGYMDRLLEQDPAAFFKFSLINIPATHRRTIPPSPWWAARIRAALWEDCGPCVQMVCNMALEAGVRAEVVSAIAASGMAALDDETALAVRFTEAVLAHDTAAESLREEVVKRWGQAGLASMALGISLTRVYPSLKYVLGHGQSCSRLRIAEHNVAPAAFESTTMPVGGLSQ